MSHPRPNQKAVEPSRVGRRYDGGGGGADGSRSGEAADRLRLTLEALDSPIRRLSFGTQRKIALWVELMTTRDLLVLDEPLGGLDPEAIAGFHHLARELVQSGGAILMSSHLL